MRKILNRVLSVLKGQTYKIDPNIPLSYLLAVFIRRFAMILVGLFLFCKKRGVVFVAFNVKIRCRSKLKLGSGVTIDRGCYIDALSYNGIQLGDNVSLGKYTTIECTGSLLSLGKGLQVGNNVGLGSHGFWGCAGGVEVGNDTIFGNYVSIHSENHNFSDMEKLIRLQGVSHKGIKIGSNCWIGAKVTILDGVKIGNGCIIAAGSVLVNGNYKDNAIYGGVPARLLKMRSEIVNLK